MPEESHTRTRRPTRVGAKIAVVLIPHIAHGSMHIGDVQSAIRQYSFRNTMTAGKNKIVSSQVKPFDGTGKERQIVAIDPFCLRQSTDKRTSYLHLPNRRRNLFGSVQQCVKIGRRKKLAENFEAFFTTPHPRQPIMHKGHSHEECLSQILRKMNGGTHAGCFPT